METILFVCSGNTCRSPIAEAIARHMVATQAVARLAGGGRAGPAQVVFASAGTAAIDGDGATEEARDALRSLGIEIGRHRARRLTRSMISGATAVYTMTGAHRRSVVAMDPASEAKVTTIDPSGADVPDPIGGPSRMYEQTAAKLRELVGLRLRERGLLEGAS